MCSRDVEQKYLLIKSNRFGFEINHIYFIRIESLSVAYKNTAAAVLRKQDDSGDDR